MNDNKKIQQISNDLLEYQKEIHDQNQKRIKAGLRCVFIIPSIFLLLMMISGVMGTSKIIFLVLWIASQFGISIYLIVVEYADYKLQSRLNRIEGKENAAVEKLIGGDRL